MNRFYALVCAFSSCLAATSKAAENFDAWLHQDASDIYICTQPDPGIWVQLQTSGDLETWTDSGSPVYSMGQEIRAWVREATTGTSGGGGGGGAANPPPSPLESVTYFIRAFTNTGGGAKSLISKPADVLGTGVLVEGAQDFTQAPPIFGWQTDNYQFLVAVSTVGWESHYSAVATGVGDAALSEFLADYSEIQTQVIDPYIQSGQSPPVSSNTGNGDGVTEIRFFRWYTPDLFQDSNGDGITDADAIEEGLDPFAPGGDTDYDNISDAVEMLTAATLYGYSPTTGDFNNNSIPDGDEDDGDGISPEEELRDYGTNPLDMDTDNDGVYDNFDAVGFNGDITWAREPSWGYAAIPLPVPSMNQFAEIILNDTHHAVVAGSNATHGYVVDLNTMTVLLQDENLKEAVINDAGQVFLNISGALEELWSPGGSTVNLPNSEGYVPFFPVPDPIDLTANPARVDGQLIDDDGWAIGCQYTLLNCSDDSLGTPLGLHYFVEFLAWPPGSTEPIALISQTEDDPCYIGSPTAHGAFRPTLVNDGEFLLFGLCGQSGGNSTFDVYRKSGSSYASPFSMTVTGLQTSARNVFYNSMPVASATEVGGAFTNGACAIAFNGAIGLAKIVTGEPASSVPTSDLVVDPGMRTEWLGLYPPRGDESRVFNNRGQVVLNTGRPSVLQDIEGYIWQNGKAVRLRELVSGGQYAEVNPTSINENGVIGALIRTQIDSPHQPAILLPVQVLEVPPGENQKAASTWLTGEANSHPTVQWDITSATIDTSGLHIQIEGIVRDRISHYAESISERVSQLTFSIGESQILATIGLGSEVGDSGDSFQQTITIPDPEAGGYVIKAETDLNVAGNAGWDEVAVVVRSIDAPSQFPFDTNELRIAFASAPSDSTVDTATVYFGSRDPLPGDDTVSESVASGAPLLGTIEGTAGSLNCELSARFPASFSTTEADAFDAVIEIDVPGVGLNQVHGYWVETGASTMVFAPEGHQSANEVLQVVSTENLIGSKNGDAVYPTAIAFGATAYLTNHPSFEIVVNGQAYPAKEFDAYGIKAIFPYDATKPNEPKLFLASSNQVPGSLVVPNYNSSSNGGEIEVEISLGGQLHRAIEIAVEAESYSPEPPAAAGGGGDPPSFWQPGEKITEEHLLLAFDLLYGQEGQDLLGYFQLGGGEIEMGDVFDDLDIDYYFRLDQKIIIQIEDDDPTVGGVPYHPGIAAQLLWKGLHQALAFWEVRVNIPLEDFNALVASRESVGPIAAQVGIAASELYLSGIGIVSDGADLVLVVNEVAEGNYVAVAGAIPFIPSSWFRAGRKLVFKNGADEVVDSIDSASSLEAIQGLYLENDLRVMGVVMEREQFGTFLRQTLAGGGGSIPVPTDRNALRKALLELRSKPFPNAQAHHDFPWARRDWFARHGLDVNDPTWGRWVDALDHSTWHNKAAEKYNDFWENFILAEDRANPYSIQEILEHLRKARDVYRVTNGTG